MRRIVRPRTLIVTAALVLGCAIPVAIAATTQPTPACPHGYRLGQYRVVRSKARTRTLVLCLRATTRTVPGPVRTVTSPAPAGATPTTSTATATDQSTVTDTTTVVGAPVTATLTAPAVTETLPVVTQTATLTPAAVTATVTQTRTLTVASSAVASLAWCGGHGGSWSDGNCDAPPNPLGVSAGASVVLDAGTTGALVSEPFPLGYLSFTVTGPGTATQRDQGYGLNPDASQDCSRVENFSGQAVGGCAFTFGAAGSYTVTVGFVDTDGNYGYPAPITTTVNVG